MSHLVCDSDPHEQSIMIVNSQYILVGLKNQLFLLDLDDGLVHNLIDNKYYSQQRNSIALEDQEEELDRQSSRLEFNPEQQNLLLVRQGVYGIRFVNIKTTLEILNDKKLDKNRVEETDLRELQAVLL